MASGRKKTQRSATVRVSLGSLIFSLLIYWGNSWNSWPELSQKLQTSELPQIYTFEVVNEYPHDRKAFTQGLLYAGNGTLYESTGLYGRSSVRRVALQTGKVEAQHNMPSSLFGEGLTLLDERLYQVTWKETFGFIYVKHNLSQLSKFNHQMTDGWGLATDGKIFFGSDGTSTLYQMDPQTMKVIKKHIIRYGGVEVIYLNELEYVNGEVWANVWQTDGDRVPTEPTDQEGTKEATKVTKEVKEVYTLVRNITNTCLDFLPGSTMHNPVFVRLITNDAGGVSANSAHGLIA
uniref:Glutaminyl-peptide cyclotransferase n=1 Tax=Opuntia streptacantha TaxID=393608 RepID=A0A7C9CPL4_OPUST